MAITAIESEDTHELFGITIESFEIKSNHLKPILINFAKRQAKNLTLLLEFLIR